MTREDGWTEDATAEIAAALKTIENMATATPKQVAEAGQELLFWGRELAGLSSRAMLATHFATALVGD